MDQCIFTAAYPRFLNTRAMLDRYSLYISFIQPFVLLSREKAFSATCSSLYENRCLPWCGFPLQLCKLTLAVNLDPPIILWNYTVFGQSALKETNLEILNLYK